MALGIVDDAGEIYRELDALAESIDFAIFRLRLRGLAYSARIDDTLLDPIIGNIMQIIKGKKPDALVYFDAIVSSLAGCKNKKVLGPLVRALQEDQDYSVRESS